MRDGGEPGLDLIEKATEGGREHAVTVLSVMGLIGVWEIMAMIISNPLKLPAFTSVLSALFVQWETILWVDLPVSLIHFAIGMGAGLLVALPIGMSIGLVEGR